MIYFVSDYHFFHRNVFDYEPIRKQFDKGLLNFEKEMIKRFNQIVNKEDTVYFVGDIFCGFNQLKKAFEVTFSEKEMAKKILSKMNGEKILLKGNHDHKSENWYKDVGFKEIEYIIEIEDFFVCHYPLCKKYWDSKFINKKQKELWSEFVNCFEESLNKKVIHGHTHSRNVDCKRHFNVSVENIGFIPISFEKIKEKLK